jgi:hypothetical protein
VHYPFVFVLNGAFAVSNNGNRNKIEEEFGYYGYRFLLVANPLTVEQ